MKPRTRNTVKAHRSQQRAKGLVRVKVKAPASDVALVKEVEVELRSREGEVRSLIRRALKPSQSLRELLAMDVEVSDAVLNEALSRHRDRARELEL